LNGWASIFIATQGASYKRHVLIIGLAARVEDPDLLANVLESSVSSGRLARCQAAL